MEYRDHPLLEGFKNESDDVLRESIVQQMDLGTYLHGGHQVGLAPEVKELLAESLKTVTRPGLEKFLYHAIVVAVKANQRERNKSGENPSVS